MQHNFPYTQRLFDCYLQWVQNGQGCYITGLANMRLNICCSHLLCKSRLNVKLISNNTMAHVCFKTQCIMTQSLLSSSNVQSLPKWNIKIPQQLIKTGTLEKWTNEYTKNSIHLQPSALKTQMLNTPNTYKTFAFLHHIRWHMIPPHVRVEPCIKYWCNVLARRQSCVTCVLHMTDWATVSNAPVQHLWIGLSSVLRPRQHSIGYMGDGFYRSKDPTNSIKVLKEQIVHRMDQLYDFTCRYVWKPENLFDIRYLPMLEVRWRSWFWSTFSIESLFKLPARKNKCNTLIIDMLAHIIQDVLAHFINITCVCTVNLQECSQTLCLE